MARRPVPPVLRWRYLNPVLSFMRRFDSETVVRTCLNTVEAEMAKGLLASEYTESVIQADDSGGMRPSLWLTGVGLRVRREDAARANKVLTEEVGSDIPN